MVNKIVKVGNQIVSLGGGIINTPNPELEVQDIDNSYIDTSAYLATDVNKGEVVYSSRIIAEDKNYPFDYGYNNNPFYFERNGRLHVMLPSRGYGPELLYFDGSGWVSAGQSPDGRGYRDTFRGWRTDGPSTTFDNEGNLVIISGFHLNPYGKYFPVWYVEDGAGWFRTKGLWMDSSGMWGNPELYMGDDSPYIRQYEAAGWENFGGTIHAAVGWQPIANTTTQADYESNFSGLGSMQTYTVDPDTWEWTKTNFDTSCPFRHANGVQFIEFSGTKFMMVYDGEVYAKTTLGLGDTYENGFGETRTTPSNISTVIWVWSDSENRWKFLQWDPVYRGAGHLPKIKVLESGELVVINNRNGASQYFYSPWKFNTSTSSFEEWGTLNSSSNTYYGNCRPDMFYVSGDYYMVVGGNATYRYASDAGGEVHAYNQNTAWDKSAFKIFKYNSVTDIWDLLPNQPSFRIGRASPAYYYSSFSLGTLACTTFNNEIHVVAGSYDYGPDTVKFYTFDVATETLVEKNTNPYVPNQYAGNYILDIFDFTRNGKDYKAIANDGFPYVQLLEYQTSGSASGTWDCAGNKKGFVLDSYTEYSRYTARFSYDGSNLICYQAHAGSNRLDIHKYNWDEDYFEKISDDNYAGTKPTSHLFSLELVSLSGYDYLFGLKYNTNTPYIYEIQQDASGLPYLVDASAVPTLSWQGGITTLRQQQRAIAFDNKIFVAYTPYNAPYIPEYKYWDGSSASWVDCNIGIYPNNFDVSAIINTYGNSKINRMRKTPSFWVHDGELYSWLLHDYFQCFYILKYNPSTNKFDVIQNFWEAGFAGTTMRISVMDPPVYWKGKYWFIMSFNNSYAPLTSLLSFDPSSYKIEHGIVEESSVQTKGSRFDYCSKLQISPEGDELQFWTSNLWGNRNIQVRKLNEEIWARGGKAWRRWGDTRNSLPEYALGVALESGSKGDTIKIRRIPHR